MKKTNYNLINTESAAREITLWVLKRINGWRVLKGELENGNRFESWYLFAEGLEQRAYRKTCECAPGNIIH